MARVPTNESLIGRVDSMRPQGPIPDAPRSPLPGALVEAGRDVERFASSMQKIEDQESTLDVTRAQAAWTKARLETDNQFDYAKDQDYATWAKRHREQSGQALESAAALIRDPYRREMFRARNAADIDAGNVRVTERAADIGRKADRAKFDQAIEDNVSAATAPNIAPADAEKVSAQAKAAIDSAVRTGMLTPEEGVKQWQRFQQRRAGIQVERDIQTDPEGTRERFGRGATRSVVDRIIGVESGGDPNARNPNSTATGAGQFIEGTWMQFIRERYPDLAGDRQAALALRNDPAKSREAVAWYAKRNSETLRENGFQDTPGNIYLGHFLGPQGAVKALRADREASAESVLGSDVVNANPFLRGKSIGWVREWADNKMAGASGPIDDRYRRLTPEQQARYADQADRAGNGFLSQRRLDREEVRSQVRDDLASIETTGIGLEGLTRERVASIMGEAGARDWERDRARAKTWHETTRDFNTMPAEQIQQVIESKRPRGGAEDFAAEQKAYERLRKEGDRIIEQRQQDPAASVQRVERVQQAEAAMRSAPTSADAWRALAKARVDAQRAVGVPDQTLSPITSREATALAQPVIDASAKSPAELKVALDNLQGVLERNFGEYADEAMAFILQTASMSKDAADAAHVVLRKILKGQNPTPAELRAVDEAAAAEAAGQALGIPAPTPPGQRRSTTGAMSRAMRDPSNGQPMPPVQDMDPNASNRSRRPSDEALRALRDGAVSEAEFDAVFGKGAAKKVLPILRGGRGQGGTTP